VSNDSTDRTTIFVGSPQAGTAAERDEIGHYLVMLEGGEPGRRILLGPNPLTIGRDAARDIVLADPDVSRLHARISLYGDRVIVEDQHSTNGTFIDGQAVVGPAVLADGSLLTLGHQVLKLERRSKRDVERSEDIRRDLDRGITEVAIALPALSAMAQESGRI